MILFSSLFFSLLLSRMESDSNAMAQFLALLPKPIYREHSEVHSAFVMNYPCRVSTGSKAKRPKFPNKLINNHRVSPAELAEIKLISRDSMNQVAIYVDDNKESKLPRFNHKEYIRKFSQFQVRFLTAKTEFAKKHPFFEYYEAAAKEFKESQSNDDSNASSRADSHAGSQNNEMPSADAKKEKSPEKDDVVTGIDQLKVSTVQTDLENIENETVNKAVLEGAENETANKTASETAENDEKKVVGKKNEAVMDVDEQKVDENKNENINSNKKNNNNRRQTEKAKKRDSRKKSRGVRKGSRKRGRDDWEDGQCTDQSLNEPPLKIAKKGR